MHIAQTYIIQYTENNTIRLKQAQISIVLYIWWWYDSWI